MSEKCDGRVYNGYRHWPCSNPAKYEQGGRHFCGVHNPAAAEKRAARSRAAYEERLAKTRARSDEVKRTQEDARRYRNLRDALLDRMHNRESAVFSAFYDHPTPQDAATFDSYLDAAIAANDKFTITESGLQALREARLNGEVKAGGE